MAFEPAWGERLAADSELIEQRLTTEQRKLIEGLPVAIEQRYHVQLVLVIGSRARGDHRPDSDLDVYVEAVGVPEDPAQAPVVPDEHFNVLVVPAGVNVPAGEEFATRVAREAVIAYDTGASRDVLIQLDEQGPLD